MKICDRCETREKEMEITKIVIGTPNVPNAENNEEFETIYERITVDLCENCWEQLVEKIKDFIKPMPKEA